MQNNSILAFDWLKLDLNNYRIKYQGFRFGVSKQIKNLQQEGHVTIILFLYIQEFKITKIICFPLVFQMRQVTSILIVILGVMNSRSYSQQFSGNGGSFMSSSSSSSSATVSHSSYVGSDGVTKGECAYIDTQGREVKVNK